MTGWGADGRTNPKWRSCPHPYMVEDRCQDCRARRVESEPRDRPAGGGIPLGSPLLVKPELKGMARYDFQGDSQSKDRFMHGKAHL